MSATAIAPPTPAVGLMTGDDFLAQYGDQTGYELAKGHLEEIPLPGAIHGHVGFKASILFGNYILEHKLGWVFLNDTFIRTRTNPDGVRGADVCFVSYTTRPADNPPPLGALIPPLELVIEVRSPSDTIGQMTAKAAEHLDAGVKVVVILDPQTDSAGVFRPDELPQRFHNGDELKLDDILPGFAVPVARFFE